MEPETWGSKDAYFARNPDEVSGAEESRAVSSRLKALLQDCAPDARERVNAAVRDWNQSVREQLRAETALRLSSADKQVSVPVRVVDGVPPPLWVLNDIPDHVLRLVLLRGWFASSVRGVQLLRQRRSDVIDFLAKGHLPSDAVPSVAELQQLGRLLEVLSDELQNVDLFGKIWEKPVDWLGAYFYRKPVIEIYWVSIGLAAARYQVDVQALTYVVLAHELAHAYTHRGFDIDGHGWDTAAFAKTSGYIVEGLAQYYTRALCHKSKERYPAASAAFLALLEHQRPGPYADFEGWMESESNPGERLRQTMLEVRRRGVKDYEGFRALLDGDAQ